VTRHIAEKTDSEGRVYLKALGFLDGKSYRGSSTCAYPRTNALRIMTQNPNARHPGDWPTPQDQHTALEELRQRIKLV